MSKVLSSSLAPVWSNRFPQIYKRPFASKVHIKGSWNEAPLCEGRKMPKADKTCHQRHATCSGVISACGRFKWQDCVEPSIKPKYGLSCCYNHNLSKPSCDPPLRKKKKTEEIPFKSMWETCDIEKTCPDLVPRLDEFHYKSSDKSKRKYTQTWVSCKDVIRKKKVCCIDNLCGSSPPLEKRPISKCPDLAKEDDSEQLKIDYNLLRKCNEEPNENPNTRKVNRCKKIVMPCCRKVSANLKCTRNREAKMCLKQCCPYPSFSECDHAILSKGPPKECRCIHFPNMCEVYKYKIRQKQYSIPPLVPAWPPRRPK